MVSLCYTAAELILMMQFTAVHLSNLSTVLLLLLYSQSVSQSVSETVSWYLVQKVGTVSQSVNRSVSQSGSWHSESVQRVSTMQVFVLT